MPAERGRLAAIEAMLPEETARLWDIGCDHGLLSLSFLENNKNKKAYLVDKREGPLSKAAGNLAAFIDGGRAELMLADGLAGWKPQAGDAVVIAGMGGREITALLARFGRMPAARTSEEYDFILQPMQDMELLRRSLRGAGLLPQAQLLCLDKDKIYSIERYKIPLSALADIEGAAYTDEPADWLGLCLWENSEAFRRENSPEHTLRYIKKQMHSAGNELKGLEGSRRQARSAMLKAVEERKENYETKGNYQTDGGAGRP